MSVNDPMMESKHHDPMLDGITRFDHIVSTKDEVLPVMVANGKYVLFSDLPALIAAAREDERGKALNEIPAIAVYGERLRSEGYDAGQRDEREACIALVETVAQSGAYIDYVEIDSVIAAIRARSDGGES